MLFPGPLDCKKRLADFSLQTNARNRLTVEEQAERHRPGNFGSATILLHVRNVINAGQILGVLRAGSPACAAQQSDSARPRHHRALRIDRGGRRDHREAEQDGELFARRGLEITSTTHKNPYNPLHDVATAPSVVLDLNPANWQGEGRGGPYVDWLQTKWSAGIPTFLPKKVDSKFEGKFRNGHCNMD